MKKIAVIGAVLDEPLKCQEIFNTIVAEYNHMIKGRMGIPFDLEGISVVSLTIIGEMDEINSFTGKLGKIPHVSVKTSISKKEIN